MSWLLWCSGAHPGGPGEAPGPQRWWQDHPGPGVGEVDALPSSESGGLKRLDAEGWVPGEAGSSPEGHWPGSHPSAPGVAVRLAMGVDQGIGAGGVTGPRAPAVTRQR